MAGRLPTPALATGSVNLSGGPAELRAMSFSEARRMRDLDEAQRVAWMVACSTGVTVADAEAWLAVASVEDGADLLLAITELSGLEDSVTVKGTPKRSPAKRRTSASS